MRWFRFYDEVLEDPKVQKLHPRLFRVWVNLLCLANRSDPRGRLPRVDDIAFALRLAPDATCEVLGSLHEAGLLELDSEGHSGYSIHGWSLRQRESDDSIPRVRRYRNGKTTVTVTPPDTETEQIQNRVEENRPKSVTVTTTGFDIDPQLLVRWVTAYPAVDVPGEVKAAFEWTQANPANTKSNWQRFLVAWLKRSQDRAPRVVASPVEVPKVRPAPIPDLSPEQVAVNRERFAEMTRSLARDKGLSPS